VAGWEERLRDGERILIRPIEPDDREELADGIRRLSPESRYRRFLSGMAGLSEKQLEYLTNVDHHDHEALVAIEPDTERGIGVARFVRSEEDREVAEFAVAVADDWHSRGVGTALLLRLTERARDEGIRRFSGSILEENRPMLNLAHELGEVRVRDRAAGAVEIEVELPDEGIGAALREALRAAARGVVGVRMPHRG
jgi:RimJ/RimL family protein N-acetyltransferase